MKLKKYLKPINAVINPRGYGKIYMKNKVNNKKEWQDILIVASLLIANTLLLMYVISNI